MRSATTAVLAIAAAVLFPPAAVFVDAGARFVMTTPAPKCFRVEVPSETSVRIHYEAPDSDTSQRDNSRLSYITLLEQPIDTLEGMRLEHATDHASLEKRRAMLNDLSQRERAGIRPVSNAMKEPAGSFLYKTHGADSVVEVCVRDKDVSARSPKSFHIRVEELEGGEEEDEEALDFFEEITEDRKNQVPRKDVEHHWTFLEAQLNRIEHEIHTIIREADFFRERDALYHQQMDDLNKATVFWPVLHICILLLTGFTQANHIISFFKQHRII